MRLRYGCLFFSYFYLWIAAGGVWGSGLPALSYTLLSATALLLSSAAVASANASLRKNGSCAALWIAIPLLAVAYGANMVALSGLSPSSSAYAAIVAAVLVIDGFFVASVVILALFALARRATGRLDAVRRVTFDNARLLWHYTVAQSLGGLALIHGFPRLVS